MNHKLQTIAVSVPMYSTLVAALIQQFNSLRSYGVPLARSVLTNRTTSQMQVTGG